MGVTNEPNPLLDSLASQKEEAEAGVVRAPSFDWFRPFGHGLKLLGEMSCRACD